MNYSLNQVVVTFRKSSLNRLQLLLAVVISILLPIRSQADTAFIDSGTGLVSDVDGLFYAVTSYANEAEGIAFFAPTKKIPLQFFNPSRLEKTKIFHLFFAYNPTSNLYSNLIVGNNIYKIFGNFTINLPNNIVISLDNSNTYLTINYNDKKLLAYRGLQLVLNTELNSKNSAILLADQYTSQYGIQPYTLENSAGNQSLKIGKKPVTENFIGINIRQQSSPCSTDQEPLYLAKSELHYLAKIKNSQERLNFLSKTFTKNSTKYYFGYDYILLRSTKSALVYFNLERLTITIVTPMESTFNNKTVCAVSKEIPV